MTCSIHSDIYISVPCFFLLPLTHGAQDLKELNLVRYGTRNMFWLSDDILSQGGWPTFISIARYKACIFRSMMLRLTIKHISRNSAKEPSECHTDKIIFPFPFTLNGIWSWWQFSFRFWTKWNSIWLRIERKTVTTIISHSMWKEMEI